MISVTSVVSGSVLLPLAGPWKHALVLSDCQADPKGWKVTCHVRTVIDIVAKIQAQTHSFEGPVVNAAAEIEKIVRDKGVVVERPRIAGVNEGDKLRFARGRKQTIGSVN